MWCTFHLTLNDRALPNNHPAERAKMDQWLDSLSEDWVSQPRSPHSDQARRSSSAPSVASPTSNASQSRIPRYKPRASSSLAVAGAPQSKQTFTSLNHSGRKNALKERSSSNLNIARNHSFEGIPSSGSPGAKPRPGNKRNASTTSIPSVPQDTIQHRSVRVSPAKENGPGSTPEWKRRVVQGKAGSTGPDLFGPIGLESIFKPPTVGRASKSDLQHKRGKKYQPVRVDEFPSSPPAFPSDVSSVDRSGATDRRRSSLLKQMEILEEVAEGDSRNSSSGTGHHEHDQHGDLPRKTGDTVSDSDGAEEDRNEVLSQVVIPGRYGNRNESSRDTDRSLPEQPRNPPAAAVTTHKKEAPGYHRAHRSSGASPSSSAAGDLAIPSLPDDLSTGTDLYVANGGFVDVRRGGYSNEGSFYRRPLSPTSSLPDFDAPELRSPSSARRTPLRRNGESEVSGRLLDQPRSAPVTPHRKQPTASSSGDEPQSSGSPLKLFDKYDTFTNDRLIRRISKFEKSTHESEEEPSEQASPPDHSIRPIKKSSKIRASRQQTGESSDQRPKRRIDSFGDGQLDNYPFGTEHAIDSKSRPRANSTEIRPGDSREHSAFRFQGLQIESLGVEEVNVQVDATQTINGKRLPYSPPKASRAKRRRTLRSSEELQLEIHQNAKPADVTTTVHLKVNNSNATGDQTMEAPSSAIKVLAGKKRKDARYDSDSQIADPRILALRQILRPRTPTLTQRGFPQGLAAEASQKGMRLNMDQSNGSQTPTRDLDHQTQALAGELATFTLNMAQDMAHEPRKASVTTADFFNEAKQIMQLIRNQARPPSSHAIAEENEPDNEDDGIPQSQVEQSTIDEFSRPPSREGGGPGRLQEPAQLDARVASHLRKFEDTDDLGLALPSSVKSMHITDSHNPALSPDKSMDVGGQQEDIGPHSDPPNIRIRSRTQNQTIKDDVLIAQGDGLPTSAGTGARSSNSQSSVASTHRSMPSGSSRGSRGSGTKAVIAPQVVSHLLSDNMGAMTFDHSKQIWIKRKSSQKPRSTSHSRTGSDATEDLFKDIPDLSVDETQEQQRTQRNESIKVAGSASDGVSNHDHITEQNDEEPNSRPQTRDSAGMETVDQSSAPSKRSRFASSGPVPETRATSWGEEVVARKSVSAQVHAINTNPPTNDNTHSEEVEHEISILEGRTSETPRHVHHGYRQPRVVTVAFSSPLVDQVQLLRDDGNAIAWEDDDSDLDLAESPVHHESQPPSAGRRRTSSRPGKRSGYRTSSRRASIGFARPMSRVDENEELAFLQTFHGPQNASMEVIVKTPLPVSQNTPLQSALSSAQTSSVGFQLSPLSEFTVHKNDDLDDHDGRHIVKHRGFLSTHEVTGRLSLAVQDLVKRLTDIEPYEPYWDDIRQLDLRNRDLATLHQLDEFCGHIEDLDVSNNKLDQLNGAPSWLRHLRVRSNSISSLTSWGHLQNLQYLDVSDNQIQSLVGFHNLVHLRELTANDNQIESLEGILELDGLIKLTLRNNCIKTLDLQSCNL